MQDLYRSSALLIVIVCTFLACGPFAPFDPNLTPDEPYYDVLDNWACRPEIDGELCDYIPPNDFGWSDNQATAEADCFAVNGTLMLGGNAWNAPAEYEGFFYAVGLKGEFSVFNGTCRIYAPRYRGSSFAPFINMSPDRDSFTAANEVAYSDVHDAFIHYLQHWNEGRPFFLVGHSQGSWHAERLIREEIEGTALADSLVAAYLIGGALRTDSFTETPSCNDPLETGCVVGWNTASNIFTRGADYVGAINPFGYWVPGVPHCTNPLSWINEGGPVDKESNPGSVSAILPQKGVEPGFVGASCETGEGPEKGVLRVEQVTEFVRSIKYVTFLGEDYHGGDYGFFYASIRENAQDRLDSYLQ